MKHKNILLVASSFDATLQSLDFAFDQLLDENGTVTIFNNIETTILDPSSFSPSYFAIIEQVFTNDDTRLIENFNVLHPELDTSKIESIIVYGSKEQNIIDLAKEYDALIIHTKNILQSKVNPNYIAKQVTIPVYQIK